MIKVFITGISGFIGSFLAEYLVEKGVEVYGIIYDWEEIENIEHIKNEIGLYDCDIRNAPLLEDIIEKTNPDIIFHLSSQAYVVPSWEDPKTTMEVNVFGTINLFDTIRKLGIDPVIVVACSSAEYGNAATAYVPLKEDAPLLPLSPYAVSKVTQDLLSFQYFRNFGLRTIRARIFGTIGPRKKGDACADFAEQIAKIEAGLQKPLMLIGNLETRRDLTDVRDMVRALWLMTRGGGSCGEVYNICGGKAYKIRQILEKLLSLTKMKITVEQDPKKMRYTDEPTILGDNTKIRELCGWEPKIPIQKSIRDILNYWRNVYVG